MKLAAIANRAAVAQTTARRKLGSITGVALEVASNPRLPLTQESLDRRLWMSPPSAGRRRDRDDEARNRVDRDPEMARSRRSAKRVLREGASHRLRS
jgi:hypothetical protein